MRRILDVLDIQGRARSVAVLGVMVPCVGLAVVGAIGIAEGHTRAGLVALAVSSLGVASVGGFLSRPIVWVLRTAVRARVEDHPCSASAVVDVPLEQFLVEARGALSELASPLVEHRDEVGVVLWGRTPPAEHYFGQLVSVTLTPSDSGVHVLLESSLSEPALRDFGRNEANVSFLLDRLGMPTSI